MPRLLAATAVGLVLAVAGIAGVAIANPPVPVATTAAVPAKVDPFRLVDAVGRAHDLYRLKDATAVVLVMHGADVSKTGAELEKLKAAYGDKGVEFFMLNSTLGADRDKVAAEAKKIGLTVPVLMDDQQLVGEQLGATRSSEAFVLNPKTWAVAYHGAVSDGKKAYLADALEAAVNGKPVTPEQRVRVTANDFLVDSPGSVFGQGSERQAGPVDVEALEQYIRSRPGLVPDTTPRIFRLN